jgi:hypothetical protein
MLRCIDYLRAVGSGVTRTGENYGFFGTAVRGGGGGDEDEEVLPDPDPEVVLPVLLDRGVAVPSPLPPCV